jgi:hypothetical protein
MKNRSIKILLTLSALSIMPYFAFANGGDQRVVENQYLINLSRAPFTPRVGVKTSFLASFVDIQKSKLISEDLIVRVRISKLGDAPKGNFIFEQDNIAVKGGVLDFSYTFSEAVLHEIFFDFAFASNPEKIYNAPDFLIDVQPTKNTEGANKLLFVGAGLGIIIAFLAGLLVGRKIKTAS